MPDPAPQRFATKLFQSIFWFISCLPSFQHIPKHTADDYVGRTSPLLATTAAFWIAAIALIVVWGIANGMFMTNMAWRGIENAVDVGALFVLVLYIAGFYQFFNRETDYPN